MFVGTAASVLIWIGQGGVALSSAKDDPNSTGYELDNWMWEHIFPSGSSLDSAWLGVSSSHLNLQPTITNVLPFLSPSDKSSSSSSFPSSLLSIISANNDSATEQIHSLRNVPRSEPAPSGGAVFVFVVYLLLLLLIQALFFSSFSPFMAMMVEFVPVSQIGAAAGW